MHNEEHVAEEKASLNFIEEIVEENLKSESGLEIHTRFPPEPNGYLHIGHAKSICLNFGLANKYKGKCNLRFDDTNPTTEETEYVDSIMQDVRWLGFDWDTRLFYASDYFDQLYEWAVQLIKTGHAYVCDQSAEEVSANRGTPTVPATPSPFRDRTPEESLALFARMKEGEFPDGSRTLRAKIDLASPNMHMRDPVLYRIMHSKHHRTGSKWSIYPMYDYAHGQSDYLEGITHSICTLEFEVHRPLYEWFLKALNLPRRHPRQIEFARLNLTYTVMSKRKLLRLVKENYVNGWDDPRMPTICGLRRRGYTPESLRNFAERIGIARRENVIDVSLLEFCVREDLNKKVPRVLGVLKPLKVVLTNYPAHLEDELEAIINPENPDQGSRKVPFSGELYIDQDDFMENPPKGYFRLSPGAEVRLRYGYFIRCTDVIKDSNGNISEIHCTYDPESRGGQSPDGRKVKGTIHWVSAKHAIKAEVKLYDRLFVSENPEDGSEGSDFISNLNPRSLETVEAFIEPWAAGLQAGQSCQFERLGYFCVDTESRNGKMIFNRTVTLKDTWTKISGKA